MLTYNVISNANNTLKLDVYGSGVLNMELNVNSGNTAPDPGTFIKSVDHYTTGRNNAELVDTLAINGDTKVIFSLNVGNIKVGDIIDLASEFSVKNPNTVYRVKLNAQVILTDAANSIVGNEITEWIGDYIEIYQTKTIAKNAIFKSPITSNNAYVNITAKAMSTSATASLIVEDDCGFMDIQTTKYF